VGKLNKVKRKEALKRELLEELDIITDIKSLFLTVTHQYPDFELTMHSFICTATSKNSSYMMTYQEWLPSELKSLIGQRQISIVNKLVMNG
jgi:8-oxo-dGTP diphosphatase